MKRLILALVLAAFASLGAGAEGQTPPAKPAAEKGANSPKVAKKTKKPAKKTKKAAPQKKSKKAATSKK
jgi:hypothetical protein